MYSNNSHRIPTKVVSFIPAPIAVYSNKDFICDLRYVNDFLRVFPTNKNGRNDIS